MEWQYLRLEGTDEGQCCCTDWCRFQWPRSSPWTSAQASPRSTAHRASSLRKLQEIQERPHEENAYPVDLRLQTPMKSSSQRTRHLFGVVSLRLSAQRTPEDRWADENPRITNG